MEGWKQKLSCNSKLMFSERSPIDHRPSFYYKLSSCQYFPPALNGKHLTFQKFLSFTCGIGSSNIVHNKLNCNLEGKHTPYNKLYAIIFPIIFFFKTVIGSQGSDTTTDGAQNSGFCLPKQAKGHPSACAVGLQWAGDGRGTLLGRLHTG